MGPTGEPTEIPSGQTLCLVGGGLGNAVLFSIGQAARAKGNRVVYFAGYKRIVDRYKVEEIERAADAIVWCCDEAPGFEPDRPQDRAFVGNIVAALEANVDLLGDVDHMIAIGSDAMMGAVAKARHGALAARLERTKGVASINSPMQCMMKEICAQCLQEHRDPASGTVSVVFSCFNQDQDIDVVDFASLRARLGQNGVQEELTRQWIDRTLRSLDLRVSAAAE
jgi:NAD(P)H-flavin reductase